MGFIFGTILSFILNILYAIFKLILKIFKDVLIATKLIWPVGCAIIGGVLMLIGVIKYDEFPFLLFAVLLCLSFLFTISLWVRKIRKINHIKHKQTSRRDEIFFKSDKTRQKIRQKGYSKNTHLYMTENINGQSLDTQKASVQRQEPVFFSPNKDASNFANSKIPSTSSNIEKPLVYRVKQNPNYIMHEYSDRVELYQETAQGFDFVRVDYFDNQNKA